jgi:head-tail adaptor
MSFAALLRQSLVIERYYPGIVEGTSIEPDYPLLDADGQQVYAWVTLSTVAGSVQPKTATEVAIQSQGGATMTDTVIYLLPTDVLAADRIRLAADTNGPYYEIIGVRDAAGHGHHYELDARLVK